MLVNREEEVAERILLTGTIGVDKSVLPFEFELRDWSVGFLLGSLTEFGSFCISGLRVGFGTIAGTHIKVDEKKRKKKEEESSF